MSNDTHQLMGLFKEAEGPTITDLKLSGDTAVIKLTVNDELRWFDGHFPEQAVLPGIVQINWAGQIGRALFADNAGFKQLTNIKFKTMVLPHTNMELELSYSAEKGILKFHFFNENQSFSLGSFKFIPS